MRYKYACFKSYIGFKNGMGLDKVEIDFSKSINKICLLRGANGVGKSTLMDALSPFPDPSTSYVPNQDAEKILILENQGDEYYIKISSPSDGKGGRKTTKATIMKNGLELNENGNISTYKDIIFSEFDLDSNYGSLTKLSSSDRGLGDKTPAERKKFVANIIDNLEVYNEIYKTLNKKSLIFKSHLNTLHTKIQNIGNKDNLELTLKNLKDKAGLINNELLSLNNKIVELETRASINQEQATEISELSSKKEEIENILVQIDSKIKIFQSRTHIKPDELQSKYNSDSKLLSEYSSKLNKVSSDWLIESEKLSNLSSSINELKSNISMYGEELDTNIREKYNISKTKIDTLVREINKSGYPVDTGLIINMTNLISFYEKFIKKIDAFYDGVSVDDLEYLALSYDSNNTQKLILDMNSVISEMESKKSEVKELEDKIKRITILKDRPKKCNIDSCPFISESIEINKSFGKRDPFDDLSKLQNDILELSERTTKIQENIDLSSFRDRKRMELGSIRSDIEDYKELLECFNVIELIDSDLFYKAISSGSPFNKQRDTRKLLDVLNNLKAYESEEKIFNILEVEYNSFKEKQDMIQKNESKIANKEKELSDLSIKVMELKKQKDSYDELVSSLTESLQSQQEYMNEISKRNTQIEILSPIVERLEKIQGKSSDSVKSILQINEMKNKIDSLNIELQPIDRDIQNISGQLTLLDSYYQEYELYKEKYNIIETLKKYCSPTGGGIQTIFMQLYMSKTLELSNQVLQMIFGGEYRLLDFVINQNEFRIPFVGLGMPVDDISSGSTSQICMMGMAINLVLFHQASTKFNIARLDEIDSGLSTKNRYEFVSALYSIVEILGIDQLFIISHSLETDTSMVDIIKLKSDSEYSEDRLLGNVIWNYDEEVKTSK